MSTKSKDKDESEVADKTVVFSTNVGYFDNYMEALEAFREEGTVIFKDNGLFSKVTDPANVAMCVSKIEGRALNGFTLTGTDELEAGIRFDRVRECLKGVSNTSELVVTWPVSRHGSKLIQLDVVDEDLQFEITTVDPDAISDIPQQDALSHNTRVVVGGNQLKKSITHAGKISQKDGGSIVFETYEGVLQVRTSDKVDGNFKKQFHQSGPSSDGKLGEHESEISLQYMNSVRTLFGRGDEVTVHIADDKPVRFDVHLDDNGDAQVMYLIAPRIKS